MNLRRFVTYVYRYDQGNRGKNAGFIKADMRSDGCRMEIQVRGVERFSGKAHVNLIVRGEEPLAFAAGEMPVGVQGGRMKLFFNRNLLGDSGYTVDQILAVVIRCGGSLLVSCWSEQVPEAVLRGQFRIYGAEQEMSKSGTQPVEEEEEQGLPDEKAEKVQRRPSEEAEKQLKEVPRPAEEEKEQGLPGEEAGNLPKPAEMPRPAEEEKEQGLPGEDAGNLPKPAEMPRPAEEEEGQGLPGKEEESLPKPEEISQPLVEVCDHDGGKHESAEMLRATDVGAGEEELTSPEVSFRRIDITDIRGLPKSNWHLCSNSFLIHGFFNYHYLILKTVGKGSGKVCYLGVPGIYEQPERMMATMFGFPEFEPARVGEMPDTHGAAGGGTGVQGYWLCRLD